MLYESAYLLYIVASCYFALGCFNTSHVVTSGYDLSPLTMLWLLYFFFALCSIVCLSFGITLKPRNARKRVAEYSLNIINLQKGISCLLAVFFIGDACSRSGFLLTIPHRLEQFCFTKTIFLVSNMESQYYKEVFDFRSTNDNIFSHISVHVERDECFTNPVKNCNIECCRLQENIECCEDDGQYLKRFYTRPQISGLSYVACYLACAFTLYIRVQIVFMWCCKVIIFIWFMIDGDRCFPYGDDQAVMQDKIEEIRKNDADEDQIHLEFAWLLRAPLIIVIRMMDPFVMSNFENSPLFFVIYILKILYSFVVIVFLLCMLIVE